MGSLTTFSTWAQAVSWMLVTGRAVDAILLIAIMNALALACLNVADTFTPRPRKNAERRHDDVEQRLRGRTSASLSISLPLQWEQRSAMRAPAAPALLGQQVALHEERPVLLS